MSFLNFADLAQYQDELSSDDVMVVDHIQDVERDDCFRYGKIKFSILYRVRGLTEWWQNSQFPLFNSAFLFLKHLFTLKTLPILFYHRKQKLSTKTLEKGFFNSA